MERIARRAWLCTAAIGTAALASPMAVHAQEPAPPPPPLRLTANAALVSAAGNTDIVTLSGDQQIDYQPTGSRWTFTERIGAVYGRTDGVTSANRIEGGLRVQRAIGERLAAFVSGKYERNRFAGIRRRFEEVAGLSYAVLRRPRTELTVEAGASFNQQRDLEGVDDAFVAARTAGAFRQLFTESAYLQQTVEFLPNVEEGDDLRINSLTALVAPLSRRFALKVSYEIRYDKLPEPGFERTDRVFTSGLQVTL